MKKTGWLIPDLQQPPPTHTHTAPSPQNVNASILLLTFACAKEEEGWAQSKLLPDNADVTLSPGEFVPHKLQFNAMMGKNGKCVCVTISINQIERFHYHFPHGSISSYTTLLLLQWNMYYTTVNTCRGETHSYTRKYYSSLSETGLQQLKTTHNLYCGIHDVCFQCVNIIKMFFPERCIVSGIDKVKQNDSKTADRSFCTAHCCHHGSKTIWAVFHSNDNNFSLTCKICFTLWQDLLHVIMLYLSDITKLHYYGQIQTGHIIRPVHFIYLDISTFLHMRDFTSINCTRQLLTISRLFTGSLSNQ